MAAKVIERKITINFNVLGLVALAVALVWKPAAALTAAFAYLYVGIGSIMLIFKLSALMTKNARIIALSALSPSEYVMQLLGYVGLFYFGYEQAALAGTIVFILNLAASLAIMARRT